MIGEYVAVNFVEQCVAIATIWPAKNTCNFSFKRLYLKNEPVNSKLWSREKHDKMQLNAKLKTIMWSSEPP